MNFRNQTTRILAGITGAAGLAYPACAAVCPKGKGDCPYPGRCFLYTDTDANSVCDYTRTTGSGAGSTTSSAAPAAPSSGGGTSLTSSGVTGPDTGLFSILQHYAPLIGIIFFVVLCTTLYRFVRSGRFGPRLGEPGPALALSAFLSLGVSEVITYFLMGDAASGSASVFAMLYIVAGSILSAYLWRCRAFSQKTVLVLAALSGVFGFALTVLIMPAEFAAVLGIALGTQTVTFGIGMIVAILFLTFLTGRTFCAHICPVGAIQELTFRNSGKKGPAINSRIPEGIRLGVFVAAFIAALWGIDLIGFAGAYDFFALTLSIWSVIFIILLALATAIYRPVCRAICPFGLIFSLVAQFSRSRLSRTTACTRCKKCENACPAGVAGENDSKRECYLCARCTDACPAEAIVYGKGISPKRHP